MQTQNILKKHKGMQVKALKIRNLSGRSDNIFFARRVSQRGVLKFRGYLFLFIPADRTVFPFCDLIGEPFAMGAGYGSKERKVTIEL